MKAMRKRKSEPGFEGKFEPRPATVVSPYLNAEVKGQQTEKVMRNVRHDVLEYEYAHKRIDDAQKAAGDMLLGIYQRAGIGGARAIDYGQAKVDTSARDNSLSDSVIAAHIKLDKIANWLGQQDYALLIAAVCENRKLKDIALKWAGPFLSANAKSEAEGYVGRRFRDALTSLADCLGVAPAQGKGSAIRVQVSEVSLHRPDLWETHVPFSSMQATG